MIYTWKHKDTGLKVEVERSLKDSNLAPNLAELSNIGLYEDEFTAEGAWEKVITGGSFSKGFSGVGVGKGYW